MNKKVVIRMSNLGSYQVLTSLAKKLGGPKSFVGIVGIGGYAVLRSTEGLAKKIIETKQQNK